MDTAPGPLRLEIPAPAGPPPGTQDHAAVAQPITLRTIRDLAAKDEPFACLTCYDATIARWLQRAGVPILLVGDTAAEVVLGFSRTIDMPLDVLLALTAGVKRGAPNCMVMGDMPFLSYQANPDQAVLNAGRFLTEGLADIVKVEADEAFAPLVSRMARAGIPICGHIGSRPQLAGLSGGYSAAGRTAAEARQIVRDAVALERAGCVMLLIEAVPDEVTKAVLEATSLPLIGIGAGPQCHGQVLVLQDLLGLSEHPPRFAEPVAQLGAAIQKAGAEWVNRVRNRRIGGRRYFMPESESQKLRNDGAPKPE